MYAYNIWQKRDVFGIIWTGFNTTNSTDSTRLINHPTASSIVLHRVFHRVLQFNVKLQRSNCTNRVAVGFDNERVVPFRPESVSLLTLAYFASRRWKRNYRSLCVWFQTFLALSRKTLVSDTAWSQWSFVEVQTANRYKDGKRAPQNIKIDRSLTDVQIFQFRAKETSVVAI